MITCKRKLNLKDIQQSPDYNICIIRGKLKSQNKGKNTEIYINKEL